LADILAISRPAPAAATFDEFWRVYPRRVGKPLARAKWEAITNGGLRTRTLDRDSGQFVDIELSATPEELVAGARRYRDAQVDKTTFKLKDNGKFILHPATFLNQGRWEDES
jgi:hypothetical protein